MTTVEKGDAFENKVFAMLKELIESGQLTIDRKNYRIFQKKGFYSKAQESDIIFDISIEVYMPNADEYSLLWLIECKDQSSPIPVSKVRNFSEQVREVGGHKAVFITTNKYQSGGIKIAKSHGMGLIILNESNSFDWVVRRSLNSNRYNLSKSEEYFSGNGVIDTPFIAYDYPAVYGHIIDFLLANDIDVKSSGIKVPYIDPDSLAVKAMDTACLEKGNHIFEMSSHNMLEIIRKYGVEIELDRELIDGELARYDVKNKTVLVSNDLQFDTPRWRFTIAHELGHVVLHKELLEAHGIEDISDDNNIIGSHNIMSSIMDKEQKLLEIQANKFASLFLMPMVPLVFQFILAKDKNGIPYPTLYLDEQEVNIADCDRVFFQLSEKFGVSKEAVKYRLINAKLCRQGRAVDKIRNLVTNVVGG